MPGFTFNPWWGCSKVSPACDACYAETWAKRVGQQIWGPDAPRRFFGEKHWNAPLAWDRAALKLDEQHLVFCASMSDVFEKRSDLDAEREKLWRLIAKTPNLVWLLLTKRSNMIRGMVPWTGAWPSNVWLGVTCETPAYRWRIEKALEHDAAVHFVSYEPAIEDVDFSPFLGSKRGAVRWLIAGTENTSIARARPMSLARAERAVAQARHAGAAPFVKQVDAGLIGIGRKGEPIKKLDLLPEHLRVREHPDVFSKPKPAAQGTLGGIQ